MSNKKIIIIIFVLCLVFVITFAIIANKNKKEIENENTVNEVNELKRKVQLILREILNDYYIEKAQQGFVLC